MGDYTYTLDMYGDWGNDYVTKKYVDTNVVMDFTMDDVLKKYTPSQILKSMNQSDIEDFLRLEKLKKIQNNIKNK